MNDVGPREPVLLAEDFPRLLAWYRDTLGLEVVQLVEEGFHYAKLENAAGVRLGLASASEMGVVPGERARATFVPQFEVEDVAAFFEHLEARGARITGGPSHDPQGDFWFGGFADPEGNPCWVVSASCP